MNLSNSQVMKGQWPAPVYVAKFSDGSQVRMSFWSQVKKPLDVERGKRLCLSTQHAQSRTFARGFVDLDGRMIPHEAVEQTAPRQKPINTTKAREILERLRESARHEAGRVSIPVELYQQLAAIAA